MKLLFVADPLEGFKTYKDSTFAMMREAAARGHELLAGLDDRVIPCGPVIDSAQRLVALGGDVTADVLPGIAHELHPALIDKAIEQLRTFLPKKVWREALAEAPVIPRVASSDELGPV